MSGTFDGLAPTFDSAGSTFDGFAPSSFPAISWVFDGELPTFDASSYTFDGWTATPSGILVGGPRYIIARRYLRSFTVSALTRIRFDQIEPGEAWPLTFDFTPDLADGETLVSITSVTWSTLIGTDATPAAQLNGFAALDATSKKVIVPVRASLLSGNDYQIVVSTSTTNSVKGPILVGVLPVRL